MTSDTNIELPKRKRNKDDGELDITPMIDVTFLLLAFFVVVSKMDPQAAVELPKASYGESVPDKNCVTLIVVVDKDDETKISIFKGRSMSDDSRIPDGDEETQEEEIGNFVENELAAHPTKQAILIKAAGRVKTGMVEMVKRGVGQSELGKSRKIYVGIEEEQ
ncbi:MAG: biopolymer transporter ExbD [Mariniblastus sp.]|nr:biopolymer transporter ExbD [Mariniblastus sp.]